MNSITQNIKFKQSVIKYSYTNGVMAASLEYNLHRKTIYRWREKYDGTLKSLVNKSRRPHRSSKAHTEAEIKLIKDYKNKNKETGLVVLWVKLKKAGSKIKNGNTAKDKNYKKIMQDRKNTEWFYGDKNK